PSVVSLGAYDVTEGLDNVLSFLERHAVVSTFFVPLDIAKRYPDAVQRLVAGGHGVGLHGDDHVPLNPDTPSDVERAKLSTWKSELEDIVGASVHGYRAPLYAATVNTRFLLPELGFTFSSNMMDSTRAYRLNAPDRSLVEFPIHWSLDDGPYLLYSAFPPNYRQFYSSDEIYRIWFPE